MRRALFKMHTRRPWFLNTSYLNKQCDWQVMYIVVSRGNISQNNWIQYYFRG